MSGDFQERFWKRSQFFLINLLEQNLLNNTLWWNSTFPSKFHTSKIFHFIKKEEKFLSETRLKNLTSNDFPNFPFAFISNNRLPISKRPTRLSMTVPRTSRKIPTSDVALKDSAVLRRKKLRLMIALLITHSRPRSVSTWLQELFLKNFHFERKREEV